MLFNSFSFLIFFPVITFLYYLVPHSWRTFLLLIASCFFYMGFVPEYILILFFLITADYFLAKKIFKSENSKKKLYFAISIFTNLGTLFFFKYFNFFNENLALLADLINWNYSPQLLYIILPLGLSFHVFQSLSYVIEVYRGKYTPETNFLNYALYVMFFPQLVAGPIERPQHLLPQFKTEHNFDFQKIKSGLERILWGFFKKIVIADNLAAYVNQVYLSPQDYSGTILAVATFFFAFQIYCDFSGYSDIAVGTAKVLGFDLMNNFNFPYISSSMAEFWRRWHISLSNWLRDYLYFPLALSAKGSSRFKLYWALFITFVLIGLWHGASWTFVAFGALHGFYLVFGQATKNLRLKLLEKTNILKFTLILNWIRVATTFILACIGFVFFRSENLQDAFYIAKNGLVGLGSGILSLLESSIHSISATTLSPWLVFLNSLLLDGGSRKQFIFLLSLIFLLIIAEIIIRRRGELENSLGNPWTKITRWSFYITTTLLIMNLGITHEIPFIYFAF